MGKFVDLTGQRFDKLLVLKYLGKYRWLCECECGEKIEKRTHHIIDGGNKTCRTCYSKRRRKHGLSNHKLISVYKNFIYRCTKIDHLQYCDYGGRGITVCDEWLDKNNGLMSFYNWAIESGYKEGLQIDRRDNDGNYEPSNCRWVTNRVNTLNTRVQKNNSSGYLGISKRKCNGRWNSRIIIFGKTISLGSFTTKKQALESRNNYIRENKLGHEYKIQEWKGE